MAAQVVEVGGKTGKVGLGPIKAALDQVDVVGVAHARLKGYAAFYDAVGHRWPQQAGQVGLDAGAQTPQGVGPCFIRGKLQLAQGAFDLRLGSLFSQGGNQARAKFRSAVHR